MINPYERAQQARERASANYRLHAEQLAEHGDKLYPIDAEGGVNRWLDAMKALDAAIEAEKGLAT